MRLQAQPNQAPKPQPKGENYILTACFVVMTIIVMRLLLPWQAVPFVFEEFLFFKGQWWEPILAAWPVFATGIVLNVIHMTTTVNPPEVQDNAPMIPIAGLTSSLFAGIMEEIVFRWVFLYGLMGAFWMGNELSKTWFDSPIIQNIATFFWPFTLLIVGPNNPILTHPAAWEIGATVGVWTIGLAFFFSNLKFQSGHMYQGPVGLIFSGIAGLFFFYIAFNYGLLASMFVHFLFDWLVAWMCFVDVLIEKALGLKKNPQGKMYEWYKTK